MDKLSLTGLQPGRVSVDLQSSEKSKDASQQTSSSAKAAVIQENRRAGQDVVEISAKALELLQQLKQKPRFG